MGRVVAEHAVLPGFRNRQDRGLEKGPDHRFPFIVGKVGQMPLFFQKIQVQPDIPVVAAGAELQGSHVARAPVRDVPVVHGAEKIDLVGRRVGGQRVAEESGALLHQAVIVGHHAPEDGDVGRVLDGGAQLLGRLFRQFIEGFLGLLLFFLCLLVVGILPVQDLQEIQKILGQQGVHHGIQFHGREVEQGLDVALFGVVELAQGVGRGPGKHEGGLGGLAAVFEPFLEGLDHEPGPLTGE